VSDDSANTVVRMESEDCTVFKSSPALHCATMEEAKSRQSTFYHKETFEQEASTGRSLSKTVWEAALLFGLPEIDVLSSAALAISVLTNVCWQFGFCSIIYSSFLERQLPEVSAFKKWRETTGHNILYMDPTTESSLADRVCRGDTSLSMASVQGDMLHDQELYLKPFMMTTQGKFLVTMVLVLWTLCIIREVCAAMTFMNTVRELPRSGATQLVMCRGKISIHTISRHRFHSAIALVLARLSVAGIMAVCGGQWLSKTVKVEDLVLNAAALGFVFEFDELLYATVLPGPLRKMVVAMKLPPLPPSKPRRCRVRKEAAQLFSLLAGLVFMLLMCNFNVEKQIRELETFVNETCNGNLNFVYTVHPVMGSVIAAPTRDARTVGHLVDDPLGVREAVREVIWQDASETAAPLTKSYPVSSVKHLLNLHTKSISELAETQTSCADTDFGLARPQVWALQRAIEHQEGMWNNSWACPDLRPFCAYRSLGSLRFLCPATCGCDDAFSGLIWSTPAHGCPRTACQTSMEYSSKLSLAPCSDIAADVLQNMTGWNAYWQSFLEYIIDDGGEGSHAHQWASDFVAGMQRHGCWLLSVHPEVHTAFCTGREFASVRSFCPESCGCANNPFADSECPKACSQLRAGPRNPQQPGLSDTNSSEWPDVPPPDVRARILKVTPRE